ncbi:MAG: SAM-dependent methyltransferase [Clostridiales bacterium]|nr:SAM-dependent methyltransferase [Clostridiales bacterium]
MTLKDNERLDDLQFNNLFIIQNSQEYLFTSDAVHLANYVKVKKGGRVIDLCSGSGIIGILVGAKNDVKDVVLVELQEHLADMSRRSIEYNKIDNVSVVCNKLQGVYKIVGANSFDVVVCNPPYKKKGTATLLNEKESIAMARHEIEVTLEEIVVESNKLLKYGGELYMINKEERLTDMLVIFRKYGIEPKELKIIPSLKGANVIMLKGKKGGKSGIKISL